MPAPILAGLVNFLQPILQETYSGIEVWTGEIPRFNSSQQPITISGTFPAFRVVMEESGFDREWTTEDPYGDKGNIYFQGWSTTLDGVMDMLGIVEVQLCDTSNWSEIVLPGGPIENPYFVYQCLYKNWFAVQVEGVRTQDSSLIYMGQIMFEVEIHGAISTR